MAARITKSVDRSLRSAAAICDKLSDPTRMRICYLLAVHGSLHVGAIVAALGQSQPNVSHHLKLLRNSGVLSAERLGKNKFYSIDSDSVRDLVLGFVPPPVKRVVKTRKSA